MEEFDKFLENSSSINVISEERQELKKSDYGKVIFSDFGYDANSNLVEYKFQITDDIHEDPCDFVGLYHIGYHNLSQCLISQLLSEIKCKKDGKLQQCAFNLNTVNYLKDGFYQFLYVTHDKEIRGASMPFEIKQMKNQPKESLDVSVTADGEDSDFLLIYHNIESKNQSIKNLLEKNQQKNQILTSELKELKDSTDKIFKEKENISVSSDVQILSWKSHDDMESQISNETVIELLKKEIEKPKIAYEQLQQKNEKLIEDYSKQNEELEQYKQFHKEHKKQNQEMEITQQLDQLSWPESLEDSNEFAVKISDLYESLCKSIHALNSTKTKLTECEEKLRDAAAAQEKQNEEIIKLCAEINDLTESVEEKDAALISKVSKIELLEREVENLKNERRQSISETKAKAIKEYCPYTEAENKIKELSTLLFELCKTTDFESLLESKRFYRIKIQLLAMLSIMGKPIDERS